MYKQKIITCLKDDVGSLFIREHGNYFSYGTYFNAFNFTALKKYTNTNKFWIDLKYKGSSELILVCRTKEKETNLVHIDLPSDKSSYISGKINFNVLPDEGIIFPRFVNTDNFELEDFTYCANAESIKISVCVIICTYKREDYVLKNIAKLKTCRHFIDKVLVIDNGQTLDTSIGDDFIQIIPNMNLGGTGGFTRGLIEAHKGNYTHVYLMDDDVFFLWEIAERAINLMACLNDEHKNNWLGFSMLPDDNPTFQYELGTNWNGIKMVQNKHNLNVSRQTNLLKNVTLDKKYNYSAWWSLIMPISVIDNYGYPFPFFIKFDDIEYGLRRNKGEEIILYNGFGLWHENFDSKYRAENEYYLMRNALITNALHKRFTYLKSLIRYCGKCVKCYFVGKFKELELISLAVTDFIKGPHYIETIDFIEKNNSLKKYGNKKINVFYGIFVIPFICVFNFLRILFCYFFAKRAYKRNFKYLTSEAFWIKKLDIKD